MTAEPEVVLRAFDAGINFFFLSADFHYPGYRHTREGLRRLFLERPGSREDVVVAVVSYMSQSEWFEAPFIEAVDEVEGLVRIDVLVAGGCDASNTAGRLARLDRYRESEFLGVRATAATFHDRELALHAIRHDLVDAAFVRYNAAHNGARADIFARLPVAPKTRLFGFKSTSGYVPQRLVEKIRPPMFSDTDAPPTISDQYRFALTRPEVDGVLCAPQTVAELEMLLACLRKGGLTDAEEALYMTLVARAVTSSNHRS